MNCKLSMLIVLFTNIILSAFCQKHDIIIERAEKIYIDTKYGNFNVSVFKISRRDTGITGFMEIYKDVYAIAHVSIQLYALFSNEYRLMPVQLSKSACEFLNSEYQWVADEIVMFGNMPRRCPVPPGTYYAKNFVLDSRRIPDMPWDKIMIWGNITLGKERLLVAAAKIYVRYDRDGMFLRKLGLG